jgi:hypothetical protein
MLGMSNARRDINCVMTPLTHSFQMILLRAERTALAPMGSCQNDLAACIFGHMAVFLSTSPRAMQPALTCAFALALCALKADAV